MEQRIGSSVDSPSRDRKGSDAARTKAACRPPYRATIETAVSAHQTRRRQHRSTSGATASAFTHIQNQPRVTMVRTAPPPSVRLGPEPTPFATGLPLTQQGACRSAAALAGAAPPRAASRGAPCRSPSATRVHVIRFPCRDSRPPSRSTPSPTHARHQQSGLPGKGWKCWRRPAAQAGRVRPVRARPDHGLRGGQAEG